MQNVKIWSFLAMLAEVPLTCADHYQRARKTYASRSLDRGVSIDGIVSVGEILGIDAALIIRGRLAAELITAPANQQD